MEEIPIDLFTVLKQKKIPTIHKGLKTVEEQKRNIEK